jgi:hypothetical protein
MKSILFNILTILFLILEAGKLLAQTTDFSSGVYILNEDWFGHRNSTLMHLSETGQFTYDLVGNNPDNAGKSLGCTSQYASFYNGRLYVISKQDQDSGESGAIRGGRIVVVDPATHKILFTQDTIFCMNGISAADGRAFVGINPHKGYISTSNGIFVFDLDNYTIKGRIASTENPLIKGGETSNTDGIGPLYHNQCGNMIASNDKVFAVMQDKGILVIDAQTDVIEHVFEGCFSTIVQSKDGRIWAVRNTESAYQDYPYGMAGEWWMGNELIAIHPTTFETDTVNFLKEFGMEDVMVEQSWYAWNAGSLCASTKDNSLFFAYNENVWSWFTRSHIYRYDIDSNELYEIYDTAEDNNYIYGAGIRVEPNSDRLWVSCYVGSNISTNNFVFYALDVNPDSESFGTRIGTYTPIKNYWYPAMFLFPEDNQTTALPNSPSTSSPNSKKILNNGQLFILRDGQYYTTLGATIN